MSFHTARLAPEKAVIRPALPLCSMPGITEMHMPKMTYAEQLKHPNWQRKRLEVLEHYGFKCYGCESKEKTLHVHHKQYIKGRQAWDYELSNFEALCEDCHKATHDTKELLSRVIASFPSQMTDRLAALLVGFGEDYVDTSLWMEVDVDLAQRGRLAWMLADLRPGEALEAVDCFLQLNPHGFMEALRSAVHKDFEG